ncbi:polcalcin Phl p 7-like [Dorcoceras hygrometricum]|uniref:Polcalcin Phl p 7-like n=1 Tax=Dorcoceras hygrometricum TaxID=472368 RepID=A0A2Z7AL21_9LAMI|nr:polcalcin Phl p 7-like [Dorcoceras hygrometricum]
MKFDSDKDRRISQQELRKSIRSRGAWFSTRKRDLGIREADLDHSGYIIELFCKARQ